MTFLRNCWYVAGYPSELDEKPIARTMLDESIVMFRTDAGQIAAMSNHCPHRFAQLDGGTVVGESIQCPYHGLRFGVDGSCVATQDGLQPPPRAKVRAYPLVVRHGVLWIWMGDQALADEEAIPDFAFLSQERCGWADAYIHVKANYQLVIDNLLDLSHAEFLHPMLASEGWMTRNVQRIEQIEDAIHVSNVAENDPMLPMLQRLRPDINPIGTWHQRQRWSAPSNLILHFEFHSGADKIILPNAHFITPETEASSHYFIRSGHFDEWDNPEYTDQYRAGVTHIFESEDVPIIEAQQRYLGGDDLMERHPAVLKNDSAAIRVRRLLAKKIRDEKAGATLTVAA